MPLPVKAKLAPKGTTGNSILDNLLNRAIDGISNGVSDVVGDSVSDAIGGSAGGIIGGEIGNVLGGLASDVAGDAIGGISGAIGDAIGGPIGDAIGELTTSSIGDGAGRGTSYFSGPASILARTGGLIFPNTPNIQYSHTANWEDYDLTHTNYSYLAYKNSKVDSLTVTGKFSVNTRVEADYVLGCIHFLRSVTKMHFGENDSAAGTPPPVLEFTALGPRGFETVPVVVNNFTSNLEEIHDYVISSSGTYVPIISIISITMMPYYNPSAQQGEFTLDEFKNGTLLRNGWI